MRTTLLNILFFSAILSYGQNSNPTYKEVVTKLYQLYKADSINQVKTLLIEKRALGWSVATIDLASNDTIREVFWDNQKKYYNSINLPKNPTNEVDDAAVDSFLKSSPYHNFNKFIYYGYAGWDNDLIALYENKKALSDLELFSLGYAYSHQASGLLNDNFDFSNVKNNFKLPFTQNSMTEKQLETYLNFENKAIKSYLELYKRNPNFETLPGQIGIKYYNELASNFLNLRIYQNEETATKAIQGLDCYSENYKLYSKDMLDSCDTNAILFTAGDNDTFPLLMYQVQNNYRTDVLIVNTSLLQDNRYVLMMKNRILNSDGIPLSLNSDFIQDKLSEVLLFSDMSDQAISIENLNEIISDKSNSSETTLNLYKTIPSKNFYLNADTNRLEWTFEEEALYRYHLIMLDIIATNKWERPLYFATNNSKDCYLGLSKYLQFEGLIYQLNKTVGEGSEDELGSVNVTKLEQNIKSRFQFKNKSNLPVEERQLVLQYRLIYNRLANYYIEKDQFQKAESILDQCMLLYPNELSYYSFDTLWIIESYYKIKSFEKAKHIQKQLLNNLNMGLDNYCFLTNSEKESNYQRTKNQLQLMIDYYEVK